MANHADGIFMLPCNMTDDEDDCDDAVSEVEHSTDEQDQDQKLDRAYAKDGVLSLNSYKCSYCGAKPRSIATDFARNKWKQFFVYNEIEPILTCSNECREKSVYSHEWVSANNLRKSNSWHSHFIRCPSNEVEYRKMVENGTIGNAVQSIADAGFSVVVEDALPVTLSLISLDRYKDAAPEPVELDGISRLIIDSLECATHAMTTSEVASSVGFPYETDNKFFILNPLLTLREHGMIESVPGVTPSFWRMAGSDVLPSNESIIKLKQIKKARRMSEESTVQENKKSVKLVASRGRPSGASSNGTIINSKTKKKPAEQATGASSAAVFLSSRSEAVEMLINRVNSGAQAGGDTVEGALNELISSALAVCKNRGKPDEARLEDFVDLAWHAVACLQARIEADK